MAERLAAVPELSTASFTVPSPPRGLYRDLIRSVGVSGGLVRPSPYSQSGHSGSSGNSTASSSCLSNSGISSRSASDAATDFGANELTVITHRMFSDGYIERMVQAFESGGDPSRELEKWLFELDVEWVLQVREGHGPRRQLQFLFQVQLPYKSASWLQELVGRWILAFIIILVSIKKVAFTVQDTPAVARFGKASILAMLVFVDAVIPVLKEGKLQAMLDMYACVSPRAPYYFTTLVASPEAHRIFNEIGGLLEIRGTMLSEAISSTMEEVRTLMEDDDSWAIELPRGGGDVHPNTRCMVDYIASMKKARASTQKSAPSHDPVYLDGLIDDTMDYLKDLLLRKSKLFLDPSLRYLFLLNNSYFIAQVVSGPSAECEKYMDSHLDVSWGNAVSSLYRKPKSIFGTTLLCCWKWDNTSSVAKFHSAFHKTYQAQRFWKVPDPQLRRVLRKTIAKRIISAYRNYLEEHPEQQKYVIDGNNSPECLEELLTELFEG
ncbi:hypothetical protein ACQJBY_063192 [Aegilops geniculata]